MKTPEEILKHHIGYRIGDSLEQRLLNAMQEYAQQIASLAWDELVGRESKETQTKEQFLNSIFNNQQETK